MNKTFEDHVSIGPEEIAVETSTEGEMRGQAAQLSVDDISGHIQIYTDATAWDEGGSCFAGIAAREGTPILAWYQRCSSSTPARAETKAILAAQRIAKERGWHPVVIFSYTQQIISAVNSSDYIYWVIDIRSLAGSFDSCLSLEADPKRGK